MATSAPNRNSEELANEVFERRVRPVLRAGDEGKFVAVDVGTEDFELDVDDYAAVSRLRNRNPAAEVWLLRVGHPTTYRLGAAR